jgi:outer membrane protein assembly factor BamB
VKWDVGCDPVPVGKCSTGTIDQSGLFTPPNAAGHQMITASLIANPSVIGLANVEVTDFRGTFMWRNDNQRSGQNQKEFALTPVTVAWPTFGKLFSCQLDGNAYAQPLYVANLTIGSGTRNVVFVSTEKDTVYAFDADANASPCVPLWQSTLIPQTVPLTEEAVQVPSMDITSKDIVPFIGITGTPVIDVSPSSSFLYVVAETQTIATNPSYFERLYALDLATGKPTIQSAGVKISTPSSVSPIFSPLLANQRAALLLDSGTVYIAFGSHQGQDNYHGWLLGYDASTLNLNPDMVFDVTPNAQQGGIWQSGGGPSADSNHNVFVATGDGPLDLVGMDFGDSFLRLNLATTLSVADFFSPCDQQMLFTSGQDLGSSAPVLVDIAGSSSQPQHLMMGGAKDGSIYVLNPDSLGGYCPPPSANVQEVPVGDGAILSTPLFWNNLIYVAAGSGTLKAIPMASGVLQLPPSSQSLKMLGPQGATPVVSSNGANNAIIWLIDTSGALTTPPAPNTPAILRAFDANDLSKEIYYSEMAPNNRDTAGLAVKFTVPTVANGKVYIGTQGELDVYGLLP